MGGGGGDCGSPVGVGGALGATIGRTHRWLMEGGDIRIPWDKGKVVSSGGESDSSPARRMSRALNLENRSISKGDT